MQASLVVPYMALGEDWRLRERNAGSFDMLRVLAICLDVLTGVRVSNVYVYVCLCLCVRFVLAFASAVYELVASPFSFSIAFLLLQNARGEVCFARSLFSGSI